MTSLERSLVLIKPDGVERRLIGQIIARYEAKGLQLVAMELRRADQQLSRQHYAEHVDKPFYASLEEFITSGPLVAMIWAGEGCIDAIRLMNGATDSASAAPGTIRGDFSMWKNRNLVHASDSAASAAREISIWFPNLREN